MTVECQPECRVGIAIVEDEKDLVKVYEKAFVKKNIIVCFVAFDGIEAVKKYLECTPRPHAVLMDYRMPIMNGIEATREILKIDAEAKIVFLSADIAVKEEAMKAGAFIFLKKPANLSTILNAIYEAMKAVPVKT
ncbi:MAG TPA: response regulator [Methanocella sp.]|nr:response regulator [Methanocella sp.]